MNIQKSFNDSISHSQLPDVGVDLIESSIDSLIQNDALKEIPIVKTFVGIAQAGVNIQDKLFLKKILTLLKGIDEIDEVTRTKIIQEIDTSEKYKIKVGEKLLYILDSCEDHEAANNIAKLFTAMLKKEITYDEYLRAASIISKLDSSTIEEFTYLYRPKPRGINIDNASSLLTTGLLSIRFEEIDVSVGEAHYDEAPDVDVSGGEIYAIVTPVGETVFKVFASQSDIDRHENEQARIQRQQGILL